MAARPGGQASLPARPSRGTRRARRRRKKTGRLGRRWKREACRTASGATLHLQHVHAQLPVPPAGAQHPEAARARKQPFPLWLTGLGSTARAPGRVVGAAGYPSCITALSVVRAAQQLTDSRWKGGRASSWELHTIDGDASCSCRAARGRIMAVPHQRTIDRRGLAARQQPWRRLRVPLYQTRPVLPLLPPPPNTLLLRPRLCVSLCPQASSPVFVRFSRPCSLNPFPCAPARLTRCALLYTGTPAAPHQPPSALPSSLLPPSGQHAHLYRHSSFQPYHICIFLSMKS